MNFMKILVAAVALQAAALLPGQAADLATVKENGVLRIGTEGTYAPYTYHDKSGKLVGFDVEIGEAIADKIGVKAQFLEGKWDGLIAGLDAGRYDAVINQVGITEARKKKYDFSDPYVASKAVLIVKEGNDEIKGFDDLKGKTAAQSLTSNYAQQARDAGAEVTAVDGFDAAVQLVLTGRADATLNDSLSYLDFHKQRPDVPLKVAATKEDASYSGVIISKGESELLAAINKALKDIKADGTYKKIAEKYFGADVSE